MNLDGSMFMNQRFTLGVDRNGGFIGLDLREGLSWKMCSIFEITFVQATTGRFIPSPQAKDAYLLELEKEINSERRLSKSHAYPKTMYLSDQARMQAK
jgi:hypothetical protein